MNVKAIIYRDYGPPDVLRYEDIDKPTPAGHEVLIRVRAASLTAVIGRQYRLCEAPDAIRDLETGHARGKLVVTMNGETR
jgi:NADPH:quinone reductase-like Zn-dependent oxidoreductase